MNFRRLQRLKKSGSIQSKRYKTPREQENKRVAQGIVRITPYGRGFVTLTGKKEEVEIEKEDLNTALHGDNVSVFVGYQKGEPRARVVQVLSRERETFVGTLEKTDSSYFLKPQNDRMYATIEIQRDKIGTAKAGDKIIVQMMQWENPKENPSGKIILVLGKSGEHETEMKAIVAEQGFNLEFPRAVEDEAHEIKDRFPALFSSEIKKRRDFRGVPTFTIDPDDAKDFDDALSVQKLSNGNVEVGIHIADVSFFVKEGSALDREAAHRGTSIYLVDRTIPMFPEILSNDLCSLKENEDKLTFSVILEFSKDGVVRKKSFAKTIIRSQKRFTYSLAQKVLDTKTGAFSNELQILNAIASLVRTKRFQRGAIEFEQDEICVELDASGKPIRIYKKERLPTHKLVEDFMLLANNEVAHFMTAHDKKIEQTFLYRVHDLPDEDKMKELGNLLRALGHTLPERKISSPISAHDINHILESAEGKAHKNLVHMATLRSMAKAIYSTKNIGHFGLSLKHYTHFTSPIRRYPDVLVHRFLFAYLVGKRVSTKELGTYEALSRYLTEMEIAADTAQRASIKYKQAEYMKEHVGKTYDGTITGVIEKGFFVRENDTFAEGMVRLRDIKDDYYVLEKTKFRLRGQKLGGTFSLGDRVRVRLKKVDVEKRLIDYELA